METDHGKYSLEDEQQMSALYDHYSRMLFYFARRFVQKTDEAEDITTEAFLQVWKRKEQFTSLDMVGKFLHTTVKNRCLDYLKHQEVKASHQQSLIRIIEEAEHFEVGEEIVRMKLMDRIYAQVEKMPPKMREIFYLSYKEGFKPAQVAERLNISLQTVKNQKGSAIRLLKSAFRDHPDILVLLAFLEIELVAISA